MAKEVDIILEGICYVLLRTNAIHPIAHRRHELLWYPESGMNLIAQVQYRRYVQSIVTESPWLIGCYDADEVRVWDRGRWCAPSRQTYGADISGILHDVLGIRQSMPSTPYDGGKAMRELVKKLEKSYKNG